MENELKTLSTLCTNAAKAVSDLNKSKNEYNFVDDKSLDIDQRIENAEGHFGRLDAIFEYKKNITTSLDTIATDLNNASNKIKSELVLYSSKSDNEKLYEICNVRIALLEEKCNKDTIPLENADERNRIIQVKNTKVETIKKSEKFINAKRQHDEEVENEKREHLTLDEKSCLEILTGYKIGSVVFDPDKDDWSKGTSVFGEKVMNKCNLCFVVEDCNHNKFGGVFTGYINKVSEYLKGGSSYIFSLVRNGTLNPKKFKKSENDTNEFYLRAQNEPYLFGFGAGHDIGVHKKGVNGSYCKPDTYTAKQKELTNDVNFTPKSVVVFQLN
uniref:TLDc domain-containing protein n=1 Tax=Entamoeba invadens TaxID=33085 RepID=S0B0P4_ENTIV|nr:hypothetical protein [Entamoeba invadens]